MPFKSKAQMGAAFSGTLGSEMQSKAKAWAHETPNIKSLPKMVGSGPTMGSASCGRMSGNHKQARGH